jgi:hypothetical protein
MDDFFISSRACRYRGVSFIVSPLRSGHIVAAVVLGRMLAAQDPGPPVHPQDRVLVICLGKTPASHHLWANTLLKTRFSG